MTDLYRLLPEEMEKLVIDMGYPRYRVDQILLPLYYKFPKTINDIPQLPKKIKRRINRVWIYNWLCKRDTPSCK